MRTALVSAFAVSVAYAGGIASAQESEETTGARKVLIEKGRALGGVQVGKIATGKLGVSLSEEFVFPIKTDRTYVIVGACGEKCIDVTLSAHDAEKEGIDSEWDDGSVALLPIEAGIEGGELHVVIEMSACDAAACAFAVGVFEKRS